MTEGTVPIGNPVICMSAEKKLAGIHLRMNMAGNRTHELWKSFMPLRKSILNSVGPDLFSLQVFDPGFDLLNFNPNAFFEKWAAVEVTGFDEIPASVEPYLLPGGLYAVFMHKGSSSEGARIFNYIFNTWLPASGYELDNRPHFEVLGEKYKNNAADSEEEIWIPVRRK